ncbi:hypothetical protein SAMN04489735_10495 [Aneurinibacillus thermoaerophilus]|nr:hypothetical protein [Aneurinibacillus thermoaerophilus]MED0676016.1 hypothetical protein [Aneurinibacillus thermoaerophilus]MED0680562.1 hypothetical protein [Aneurinibacillus thermoaerophilus]SDH73674.1 hypothetical protein SAMN04489735_10495 [Aneurinibacillus thermoaerophilus]
MWWAIVAIIVAFLMAYINFAKPVEKGEEGRKEKTYSLVHEPFLSSEHHNPY